MRVPRGIRNRNPGCIDFNVRQFRRDPWVGETGIERHRWPRFTTFENEVFGIRAIAKTLLTYHHKRHAVDGSAIDTVQEVIDRWAPPVENDTDAYAARVRHALDVERGEEIDIDDPAVLVTLCKAIIQHENGTQPYREATLRVGVDLALK